MASYSRARACTSRYGKHSDILAVFGGSRRTSDRDVRQNPPLLLNDVVHPVFETRLGETDGRGRVRATPCPHARTLAMRQVAAVAVATRARKGGKEAGGAAGLRPILAV